MLEDGHLAFKFWNWALIKVTMKLIMICFMNGILHLRFGAMDVTLILSFLFSTLVGWG